MMKQPPEFVIDQAMRQYAVTGYDVMAALAEEGYIIISEPEVMWTPEKDEFLWIEMLNHPFFGCPQDFTRELKVRVMGGEVTERYRITRYEMERYLADEKLRRFVAQKMGQRLLNKVWEFVGRKLPEDDDLFDYESGTSRDLRIPS